SRRLRRQRPSAPRALAWSRPSSESAGKGVTGGKRDSRAFPTARHQRRERHPWRRQRVGATEELLKVLSRLPKPDEEVPHVALLADVGREGEDVGMRDDAGDPSRSLISRLVPIKADVDLGDLAKVPRPLRTERERTAG